MTRILPLLGLAIIALILFFGIWYSYISSDTSNDGSVVSTSTASTSTPDAVAVSAVVTSFGLSEQKVSLLAPDASSSIASVYAPYVAHDLLARWLADPLSAPGRIASAQWPDHIVIGDIRETTDGYEITGILVMMTSDTVASGGNSGTDPVLIDLAKHGGSWLITNYEDQSGT